MHTILKSFFGRLAAGAATGLLQAPLRFGLAARDSRWRATFRIPGAKIPLIALILLVLSPSLAADTLLLKSGERIHGSIVNQSRESVTIRGRDGRTRTLPKADIERTFFGDVEEQRHRKEQEAIRKREEAERRLRDARPEPSAGYAAAFTLRLRAGIAGGSFTSDLEERLGQDLENAALVFGGLGFTGPWESNGYAGFPLGAGLDYERWSFDLAYTRTEGDANFAGLVYLPFVNAGGLSARAAQVSLNSAHLVRNRVDVRAGYRVYGAEEAGPELYLIGGLRHQQGDARLAATSVVNVQFSGFAVPQLRRSLRSDFRYEDTGPLFGPGFRWNFDGGWDLHAGLIFFRLRGGEQLSSMSLAVNSDLSTEIEAISETGDHLIRGYEAGLGVGYRIGRARLFFDVTREHSRVRDSNVQRFTASSNAFTQAGAAAGYLLSRGGSDHADRRQGVQFGVEFYL